MSIQASSACAGTADCTITVEEAGSMPAARKMAAISSILLLSSFGYWYNRDRVQVHDAENALVVVLDPHPVLERPQVVADMQVAGRLNAGKDSLFHGDVRVSRAAPGAPAGSANLYRTRFPPRLFRFHAARPWCILRGGK